MSAPTAMELHRDTTEPLVECDDCGRDWPPDQIEEVQRFTSGKWRYDKQCSECLARDAADSFKDDDAKIALKLELESLAGKILGMSLDDAYEALQALAIGMVA